MQRFIHGSNAGIVLWRQAGTPIANLLTPTGIASSEVFGTPSINGGTGGTTKPFLYRNQYIGGRTHGNIIRWYLRGGDSAVTPVGIGSTEQFGTPSLLTPVLSAADIAAIWAYVVDYDELGNAITAADGMRILLSFAAGNVTGGPDSPLFASVDSSKTRIGGTADQNGNRTRSILDGSP